MSQTFGIESSEHHRDQHAYRPAVRYLLVIGSSGAMLARMFLATRESAGEFDASCEEVGTMTSGLTPTIGACGHEWDTALSGHTANERAAAKVYKLDV